MHTTRRARRVLATLVAGAVLVTGSLFGTSAAIAAPARPLSMAALGDSITQALQTCTSFSGCPANSWSTGTTASVNSHATRLAVPTASRFNDSVSGANSSGLLAQANKAVAQKAQYVTIEIGANDACTRTVATMTSVDAYKANVSAALTALATGPGSVQPEIFLASVPSLDRLYTVNKGNASARFIWSVLGICQSMLANPSSNTPTDIARRASVQARVNAYNDVLLALCTPAIKCKFDNRAVAGYQFAASDISTRDYFHPSLAGQKTLADLTYQNSQWVL